MDWAQCLTIIASTGALFFITRKDMQIMEKNHREDMQLMDKKWSELFNLFVQLKLKQKKED